MALRKAVDLSYVPLYHAVYSIWSFFWYFPYPDVYLELGMDVMLNVIVKVVIMIKGTVQYR